MAKQFTQRKVDGIIVENNVPFPEYASSSRAWPFNKMEIGESFAVTESDMNKCRAAASYAGSRSDGWKFSIRKTPNSESPYRCWRIT